MDCLQYYYTNTLGLLVISKTILVTYIIVINSRRVQRGDHEWYQVSFTLEDLEDDGAPDVVNVKLDLRLTRVKPIHANWIFHTHSKISTQDIHVGFIKAGLCSH